VYCKGKPCVRGHAPNHRANPCWWPGKRCRGRKSIDMSSASKNGLTEPQPGRVRIAHKLQKLLVKSWYARLLAVRRISQDHRGKHPAGIDGVKSLTPAERWRLVNTLRLDSKATPLRRTWIPQRGSAAKRPLGIPTQHERARQTLVRQALEPAWEAKLSPPTSGLRPGRSCWDGREALCNWMKARPQYALKVDIQKCFDSAC
jgi:RNA-directed DNA polymerase